MKTRKIRCVLAVALIVVGVGFAIYPKITDWQYAWYQKSLELAGRAEAAGTGGGAGGAGGAGGGIALPKPAVVKLVIGRIGLNAYVMPGTTQDWLAKGPGHYEETPLPGERGNAAIAAHRTMHGGAFRHLDRLRPGDRIVTYTAARKAVYRVITTKRVDPSDVSVADPTPDSRLTLTTCNPVGSARERLVVIAKLVR